MPSMTQLLDRLTPAQVAELEQLARTRVFPGVGEEFFRTDRGRFLLEQQAYRRYLRALGNIAPWVDAVIELKGRTVVEVGSGTGSSAAGFAPHVDRVIGFELVERPIAIARERFRCLGVHNAEIHHSQPDEMLDRVCDALPTDGVLLLYAVLEHMTIAERIDCLSRVWSRIGSGGAVVVVETPNRLSYLDRHTSGLPFFHFLEVELAELYLDRSERNEFVRRIQRSSDPKQELMRAGRGVSYHEFEIGFGGDVTELIVADGFEPLITEVYAIDIEDQILERYFEQREVGRHRAFVRHHLNIVFRKP